MCEGWASVGECRRNKPFMERNCAKACSFCTPARGEACVENSVRICVRNCVRSRVRNREKNLVRNYARNCISMPVKKVEMRFV